MKKPIIILISVLLLVGCQQKSSIEQVNNLSILHLTGSPYEQGYAHGQLLKKEIHKIIGRWKVEVEETHGKDFDEVIDIFYNSTSYNDTIKKYCPSLIEEVKGISKGCCIDYSTMLAFQMSEEIDALSGELIASRCTSVSINKTVTTPTLLAQNMDPPLFLHGKPILLHILNDENKSESYIFTFPGFIGLTGLNSNSVGITCNGISMLNKSRNGLPVSFIVRSILNQINEKKAFEFIENIPISIPQCYTIGGKTTARCFECSANQKKEFYPFDNGNISLHTNFAASNRDFNQEFIKVLEVYGKTINDNYYCPRYFLAYDIIEDFNRELDVDKIKSILSSTESELDPISNKNTFGCLIMELSENPVLFLAPGKPDTTMFIRLTFNTK